jgi:hypothetical protein
VKGGPTATRTRAESRVASGPTRKPSGRAAALTAVALAVALCSGCGSGRTFAQLGTDAARVPVPADVTFVRQSQSVNDGPGFTTAKSEQVTRQYRTDLSCELLERRWADVLRAAGRKYRVANYPHSYGTSGSLGIMLTDRPEVLGVTVGTDDGHCAQPFVYAFNRPH